jgi:hypothetical protein
MRSSGLPSPSLSCTGRPLRRSRLCGPQIGLPHTDDSSKLPLLSTSRGRQVRPKSRAPKENAEEEEGVRPEGGLGDTDVAAASAAV